jgi:hypothetical protein|tara:strand:- start:675 stop:908 length:234 start_codon:yes stop_codon:yes gene_type:complete
MNLTFSIKNIILTFYGVAKKINKNLIFSFLNRKKINIIFEKIILINKFDFENTGKMNIKNLIKLINEKRNKKDRRFS